MMNKFMMLAAALVGALLAFATESFVLSLFR